MRIILHLLGFAQISFNGYAIGNVSPLINVHDWSIGHAILLASGLISGAVVLVAASLADKQG